MKKAEIAAEKLLKKMMDKVLLSLRNEMSHFLAEFNLIKSDLLTTQMEVVRYKKLLKDQETYIVDLQLQSIICNNIFIIA